jgi:hypothetical protein
MQGVKFALWNLKTLKKLLRIKIREMLCKKKMMLLRRTRHDNLFTNEKNKEVNGLKWIYKLKHDVDGKKQSKACCKELFIAAEC